MAGSVLSPAPVTPGLPAGAYAGRYSNPYFGDLEIAEDNGGLTVSLGNDLGPFELAHRDRDTFSFTFLTRSDDGEKPIAATFTVPDGKATRSVTLDFLDE